jgi:hypothetical protein
MRSTQVKKEPTKEKPAENGPEQAKVSKKKSRWTWTTPTQDKKNGELGESCDEGIMN